MQHIGRDMDDLFRNAAENYPLKNGGSNWESISKKIAENNYDAKPGITMKAEWSKKYILFIFLLIGLLAGWLIFKNNRMDRRIFSSEKNDGELSDPVRIKKSSSENMGNKTKSIVNSSIQNKKQQHSIYKPGKLVYGFTNGIDYSAAEPRDSHSQQQKLLSKIQSANAEDISNNITSTSENIIDKKTFTDISIINKNANSIKENEIKKNKKIDILNKQGGYIGLVGVVDFSNVKSFTNNSAGYGLGVLLGYKYNPKISLEMGLIANKKNYYAEGRYFNMDKIKSTMPAGMEIQSLFTKSSIIEIPIKIKYDLIGGKKSNVYISGGISAYIMTREKNNYKATVNGNGEQFYEVYNKSVYGLPAVANINFGYEHFISKFLNIRIEPFLKIPLKGIGVGNLPVTSAGLQLSITHNLN